MGGEVKSAMRSPPVISQHSDTVSNVIQKMVAFDIGAVIVTEEEKPTGIITERDILNEVFKNNKDPAKTYARDIKSQPLTIIDYNKSIPDVLKIMRDKKIRRLTVTQEGEVKGIVSQRRILAALV